MLTQYDKIQLLENELEDLQSELSSCDLEDRAQIYFEIGEINEALIELRENYVYEDDSDDKYDLSKGN